MLIRLAASIVLASLALTGALHAECPGNPGAIGVSRVIAIDTSQHLKFGTMQYPESLPLRDHEVVLTFDDGPLPPHTSKVLDVLATECVKATFFIVGQMATAYPETLQLIAREGHTIGTHTMHHAHLDRMTKEGAAKEIQGGIAAVTKVIGGGRLAPFFRFPYLDSTPAVERYVQNQGLTIWSIDHHVYDWENITPAKVAANAINSIEKTKGGILLLHDIQERTAIALPTILQELKERGYTIVHVVPANANQPKTVTLPNKSAALN